MPNDLKYRCYHFSVNTINYLKNKKWNSFSLIVAKQVMRSAMSVGANVVEAQNSSSRVEFKRFYEIALKSSTETSYWLCLLRDGFDCKDDNFESLLKESAELTKILGTSVLSIKKGINNKNKS
jgi:four helix bundle protein